MTMIMKGTRLCNLRCAYCHDWESGSDQTMSFEVLAHSIAAAMQDDTHNVVTFAWHGGETTLLPMDFYRRAMALQSRFRRPGQYVQNHLQTNATRLTAEWAEFFRRNDFGVGISLDGPSEVQDNYRPDAAGRSTFDRVLAGMRLLEEHQVSYGVLMVVDATTIARGADALFDFIVELGLKRIGLLAVNPRNQPEATWLTPTAPYTSPSTMGAFLSNLYDRWFEHGDDTISIRELSDIEQALSNGHRSCKMAGDCIGDLFVVDPNGDIAHCNLFRGDSSYTLGNLLHDDFATIRAGAKLRDLRHQHESDLAAMAACPDFEVCRGWCPHVRYLSSRHDPSFSEGCCGLRPLIDHIRSRQAGSPTTSRETREQAQRPTTLATSVLLPMPKRGPSADVLNRRADRLAKGRA
jgi:uncharacterized protein